jgi:hypothetical protein
MIPENHVEINEVLPAPPPRNGRQFHQSNVTGIRHRKETMWRRAEQKRIPDIEKRQFRFMGYDRQGVDIFLQRFIVSMPGEHGMECAYILKIRPEKIQILGDAMPHPESQPGSSRKNPPPKQIRRVGLQLGQ